MSVPSPVSYQLLRLIKWRIGGVIKGPNGPKESVGFRRIQLMIYLGMLHLYIHNDDVGCQPIIKPRTAYVSTFCCCTSGVPERND